MKQLLLFLSFLFLSINMNAQLNLDSNLEEGYTINGEKILDDNFWIADSVYHFNGDGLLWLIDYKILNEHNIDGDVLKSVSTHLDVNTGLFTIKRDSTSFTYDNDGNRIDKVNYYWNDDMQIFSDTVKYSKYNEYGQPIIVLYRFYDPVTNTFVAGSKSWYTYNDAGTLELILFDTWDATTQSMYKSGKVLFEYDANINLIKRLSFHWNLDTEEWEDIHRTTYTNNVDGQNLIKFRESYWEMDDLWIEAARNSYTYDDFGYLASDTSELRNYALGVLEYKKLSTYISDIDGEPTFKEVKKYDEPLSDWYKFNQYWYIYNVDENLESYIGVKWSDDIDNWENSFKFTNYYTEVIATDVDGLFAEKIQSYPNPVKNVLFFTEVLDGASSIDIYNIAGNKVTSSLIESNRINVSNLPKGIYFARINSGAKLFFTKFVKI